MTGNKERGTAKSTITRLTTHPHRSITSDIESLYHVGDLQSDREKPWFSTEGKELSVSPCPSTWRTISDVSGDTYKLTRSNAVFYHVNPSTSVTDGEITCCCEHGFIEMRTGAMVTEYDAEYDTNRYWKHYKERDAIQQAKQRELDPETAVSNTQVPQLTEKGITYCNDAFTQPVETLSPIDVESLLPIWSVLPVCDEYGIDGVYWDYETNINTYTAKRGLIFQSQLDNWNIKKH